MLILQTVILEAGTKPRDIFISLFVIVKYSMMSPSYCVRIYVRMYAYRTLLKQQQTLMLRALVTVSLA